MLKEFREFALKGNAIDMAVGIVIGAAFGSIVQSLVADIIMPPISVLLGAVDFSNLFFVLKNGAGGGAPYASIAAAKQAGAVTLNVGLFINQIISFLIIAFAVFMVVKNFNRLRDTVGKEETKPTTKNCPECCSAIPLEAKRCPHCTSKIE